MLDLMAVGQNDGPLPLYMHTAQRILREMRIAQQENGSGFDYQQFKRLILDSGLSPAQTEPLNQRLETLESFMPRKQRSASRKQKGGAQMGGTNWEPSVSENGLLMEAISVLLLTVIAWLPDHCGSLLSLCICWNRMFVVQYLLGYFSRTEL